MKRIIIFTLLFSALLVTGISYAEDELMNKAQNFFKVIPDRASAIEGNDATPAKVELGKMLFFEPRLSASARKARAVRAVHRRSKPRPSGSGGLPMPFRTRGR